jgi:hypothetical protein
VKFPRGCKLKQIRAGAFSGTRITSFEIPKTVALLRENAFAKCSALKEVALEEGSTHLEIERNVFEGCPIITIRVPASIDRISGNLFQPTTISTISVNQNNPRFKVDPNSQCLIAANKSGLLCVPRICHRVTLWAELRWIGDLAFYGNAVIESIVLPDSVTHIGDSAFQKCYSLTQFEILPSSRLEQVGERAFAETAIQKIEFPRGLKSMNKFVFLGAYVKAVGLPESITVIPTGTFSGCKVLEKVVSRAKAVPRHDDAFDPGVKGAVAASPTAPLWDVGLEARRRSGKRTFTGSEFDSLCSIASGAYASVSKIRMKDTQKICAKKEFVVKSPPPKIEVEANILRTLVDCPAIVGYIGEASQSSGLISSSPGFIIMEYVPNGSIGAYLERTDWKVSPTLKAKWAIGVAIALDHCHRHRVIHGDLSANNILLDSRNEVRLCDFGSAQYGGTQVSMGCGTPLYTAPEDDGPTEAADVYSYAIVLWEIVTGQRYKNSELTKLSHRERILTKIRNQQIRPKIEFVTEPWVRTWLQELWNPVTEKRGTSAMIKPRLAAQGYKIVEGVDVSAVEEYVREIQPQPPTPSKR